MAKRLRLGLWLVLGLVLSWTIACSSGPPAATGKELEFWTMQLQPQFTTYFNGLIAEFEGANPGLKVRWVDVPWSAMESKILAAVSAKTAPDVVNLNPKFASQLAARNAWLDLNREITPETKQEYLPNIWKASSLGEETFGFPWYLTTQVIIYNQDLFKQAGVTSPPQNYEELAEVAQKIKEKTGKYAFFVTFVPGDSAEVLESLVKMGVSLVDKNGKAAFDTEEGIKAFRYWVDLYEKGLLPPEVLTQGHRQAIDLYQSGQSALVATGAQFLKTIETNAPAIAKVSAVASEITGSTGKNNVAVMNLVIPRDTDIPEAAVKFAQFVTNSKNQLAFAKEARVLPSTQAAVKDYLKDLSAKKDLSAIEMASKVGAQQLTTAEVLVPAMADLNLLQKAIYENIQAAMLKQKTVEQAVIDAATTWDKIKGG